METYGLKAAMLRGSGLRLVTTAKMFGCGKNRRTLVTDCYRMRNSNGDKTSIARSSNEFYRTIAHQTQPFCSSTYATQSTIVAGSKRNVFLRGTDKGPKIAFNQTFLLSTGKLECSNISSWRCVGVGGNYYQRRWKSGFLADGGSSGGAGVSWGGLQASSGAVDSVAGSQYSPSDIGVIPDAPMIPEVVAQSLEALTDLALGGSYWPFANWLMVFLNYMHASTGLPWWQVVVAGTLTIRTLALPAMIFSQRNSALMQNAAPEMQAAQAKMDEGRRCGDMIMQQEGLIEYKDVMKKHGIKLGRTFMVLGISGFIFITFFLALKNMAHEPPVPGLKTEGLAWFQDLTERDKTWGLAALVTCSLAAVIGMGAEFGPAASTMPRLMKVGLYSFSLIAGFVSTKWAAIIPLYWLTSNCYSLGTAMLLRFPPLRRLLGIPAFKKIDRSQLPISQKSISKMLKDKMSGKSRAPPSLSELRQNDIKRFQQQARIATQRTHRAEDATASIQQQIRKGKISSLPTAKSILKKQHKV